MIISKHFKTNLSYRFLSHFVNEDKTPMGDFPVGLT